MILRSSQRVLIQGWTKALAAGLLLICSSVSLADYKDDIGYTQLVNELGLGNVPNGAGVKVTQVEADEDASESGIRYRPNEANAGFAGKTITDKSGVSNPASARSTHATNVGLLFYGNSSIASGITQIDAYEANNWLGTGFLRPLSGATPQVPLVETSRIQNHSWIGSFAEDATATDRLRRFDFMIDRDNVIAAVGVNNGTSTNVPTMLGQSYNSISVGRVDGAHSAGFSTVDGTGRIKPDIVAPQGSTSNATAVVSAAAAMLVQKADTTPGLANGSKAQVVKATLMAGATKNQFLTWDRTTTRPLDDRFGAGALNIYRSYHILAAGEQNATNLATVADTGWDWNNATASTLLYFFDVEEGESISEFSAVLTWHRLVADGGPGGGFNGLTSTMANLDLRLFYASGFALGSQLDASLSTVDNVEHIWFTDGLTTGRYALQLSVDAVGLNQQIDYGLAWHSVVIPEPGSLGLLMVTVAWVVTSRRRRGAATYAYGCAA